jgi:peptide/nickel transport system ATP-binding protein
MTPAVQTPLGASAHAPLLVVDQVTRTYKLPREKLWQAAPLVHALQGVSFTMQAGRSLGIVGESGSGKSTLARLVMALEHPTSGSVQILGRDMATLDAAKLRQARRDFQMVFQDPYGSLDPRQTVLRIVTEPLQAQGDTARDEQARQAREVLLSVGLRATDLDKYPHEFSGGQRQRIAIARALITRPRLIVADEPVSALDVSVQAQVLNLMQDLQAEFNVTYLLISHDLAVVDHLCAEVAVVFQGRIVERGSPQTLFRHAAHPYTRALLDAVPRMEPRAEGDQRRRSDAITPRAQLPGACPYAHRCPHAQPRCDAERPELTTLASGHLVACHFPQAGATVSSSAAAKGARARPVP